MEVTPTPPRQRNRRSDRYQENNDTALPASVVQPVVPDASYFSPNDRMSSERQTSSPYARRTSTACTRSEADRFSASELPIPTPRALQRTAQTERAVGTRRNAPRNDISVVRRNTPAEASADGEEEASEVSPNRLPWYLSTAMVLLLLMVMALFAAQNLMQAYLKTQADEREAAYQAMLDNYHVLTDSDGVMSVTYQDFIERYSAEYNLQPAFVTAIIRNESSFRRDAESSVGARGLMQMMPDTAEWIAGKLDMEPFSFDSMYDPETNIRFGCWYLNYLSRLFRGDPTLVTAAYHTGQTTVTRWLSDRSVSADGRTIALENMMDGPTKTYVGRVTLAYGIYHSLLYPNQPLHSATYAVPAADGAAGSSALAHR